MLQSILIPVHFPYFIRGTEDLIFEVGFPSILHIKADRNNILDRLKQKITALLKLLFILISYIIICRIRLRRIGQHLIVIRIDQLCQTHRHGIHIRFQFRQYCFLCLSDILNGLPFELSVQHHKQDNQYNQKRQHDQKKKRQVICLFQRQFFLPDIRQYLSHSHSPLVPFCDHPLITPAITTLAMIPEIVASSAPGSVYLVFVTFAARK